MTDFTIPLAPVPLSHVQAVFATPAFKNGDTPSEPLQPLTSDEMEWVQSTVAQGQKTSPAPSLAAERYLRSQFSQYDFDMPVTESQWQNFVLHRWYEMARDPDPKVAKPALDSIAKSSAANLMVEKKEISITTRSDEELQQELKSLFSALRGKTIEGTASRV